MALKPLNSVGGFSVGEIPQTIIDGNGNVTANFATLSGNLRISNTNANWGVLTDNLYYSNGVPWDLQEAAGNNNEIQFNLNDDFSASANLTFDPSTNTFTVLGNANLTTVNTTNINSGTNSLFLTANGYSLSLYANGLAEFDDGIFTTGNLTVGNANLGNAVVANFVTINNNANVVGNLVTGNADLGNLAEANYIEVSSNVTTSNLTVNNSITANTANFSGNVVVPNLTVNLELQANTANFDGNVIMDNWLVVSNTANVGNLRTDNLLYANGQPWDLQEAAGSNTEIQFNLNDDFAASANFTFDPSTNVLTVNGNANVTNTLLTPNVDSGSGNLTLTSNGFSTVYDNTGNVTFPTGGTVTVGTLIGNVQANINITAPNTTLLFSDNGLVDGSNAFIFNKLSNSVTLTGNLEVENANLGNLAYANYINVASNLVTSNLSVNLELAGNTANFSGNVVLPNLTVNTELSGNTANFSGNVVLPNLTVNLELAGNTANFSGNVTIGGELNVDLINTGTLANGTSNIRIFEDANVTISSNNVANIVVITDDSLLVAGNIESSIGNILANGNVTANGYLVGANAFITGQANVGSVLTANITATTGDITISAAGSDHSIILAPTGNGVVDVSNKRITDLADPINPLDAATKEYVDALAGEGLVIHTPVRVEANVALGGTYADGGTTLTTTDISGGKTITFSSNHGLSVNDGIVWANSFNGIIAGEGYWVVSVPALNQITIRDGYFGPEVTTLTNGTGLSESSLANPGVGATLTNNGVNAAIIVDGITLSTNDRVLVYSQPSAYENGIYVVTTVGDGSTPWVLTRASDFDKYNPGSPNGIGKGSYVFVSQGLSGAGESYVMTLPVGEVIVGTTNITFTQFSDAGSYTAGAGINITGTTISANVDNETTAIVSGNITVKAGANLTTPNIGDATFSSLTWNTLSNGNVTANNLSISNIANITLDLTVGGNIQANGTISANANVSGLNLTTSGNVQASGNVLANNITANTLLTVPTANVSNVVNAGNVDVTNALTGNTANFSGNVVLNNLTVNLELAGNTANFAGNVVANNFSTSGSGGNITGANVVSANTFSGNLEATYANVTGNVTGGNLVTNGVANVAQLNVTGNVTSDLLPNANLTHDLGNATLRWDNVYAGNLDLSGNINASGNLSANNFTANTFTANTAVEIGNTTIFAGEVTTTSITANQTISSVPVTGITGVEWLVKGNDSTGSKYSFAMVTAVTDGANADFSTFGTVNLGGTTGTIAVNVVGSNIALQVTPSSSNSTVWVTQYRTL